MSVKPGVAWLMVVEAVSLAVMSTLHLTGRLDDGSRPFQPSAAGIAEAIIAVVLFGAALTALFAPNQARPTALAAVGFAIAGFILGLTFTARGGSTADIAYHESVLPVLLVTMGLILRSGANSARMAVHE
ncbi:MAG TPA: hypothetical protein VFW65_36600 [Pseudonocardiaceae bacterium]|nr:hypothetical protein [Pseudonocardiaceae bacterium]